MHLINVQIQLIVMQRKFKFINIQRSVFSSSVLEDGQPMGGVCRTCMHSFLIDCQSLRELRITSVLRSAVIQKEMWVGSNVLAL